MVDVNELDSIIQEVEKIRCPYVTVFVPGEEPQRGQIYTLWEKGKSIKYYLRRIL